VQGPGFDSTQKKTKKSDIEMETSQDQSLATQEEEQMNIKQH
jgi:hypothetical protein